MHSAAQATVIVALVTAQLLMSAKMVGVDQIMASPFAPVRSLASKYSFPCTFIQILVVQVYSGVLGLASSKQVC